MSGTYVDNRTTECRQAGAQTDKEGTGCCRLKAGGSRQRTVCKAPVHYCYTCPRYTDLNKRRKRSSSIITRLTFVRQKCYGILVFLRSPLISYYFVFLVRAGFMECSDCSSKQAPTNWWAPHFHTTIFCWVDTHRKLEGHLFIYLFIYY